MSKAAESTQLDRIINIAATLERSARPTSDLPWQGVSEDQSSAQEAILSIYHALMLNPPRFAWAPSPKSMWLASRMLRAVQFNTAHQMIQALVPVGPDQIESAAKRTLFTAMIDPNITTQSGGLIVHMIERLLGGKGGGLRSVDDLSRIMDFHDVNTPKSFGSARFREQVMYPALYRWDSRLDALKRQAICIMPFVHIVFLSRPPLYTMRNKEGQLHCADGPAMEWADGFAIDIDRSRQDDGEQVAQLERSAIKALPAPETDSEDAS